MIHNHTFFLNYICGHKIYFLLVSLILTTFSMVFRYESDILVMGGQCRD